jgi:hypothetical protein
MNEFDAVAMTFLDDTQLAAFFRNRIFRTDFHTPAATVTQLIKNQNRFIDHRDGLKLAYIAAFPTKCAPFLINFGHGREYRFCFLEGWVDKKVRIGLFNITVKQLNISADG